MALGSSILSGVGSQAATLYWLAVSTCLVMTFGDCIVESRHYARVSVGRMGYHCAIDHARIVVQRTTSPKSTYHYHSTFPAFSTFLTFTSNSKAPSVTFRHLTFASDQDILSTPLDWKIRLAAWRTLYSERVFLCWLLYWLSLRSPRTHEL